MNGTPEQSSRAMKLCTREAARPWRPEGRAYGVGRYGLHDGVAAHGAREYGVPLKGANMEWAATAVRRSRRKSAPLPPATASSVPSRGLGEDMIFTRAAEAGLTPANLK